MSDDSEKRSEVQRYTWSQIHMQANTWENYLSEWVPNDDYAAKAAECEELRAALFAYASEFDGDTGSIHQNIRDLKRNFDEVVEKADELRAKVEDLTRNYGTSEREVVELLQKVKRLEAEIQLCSGSCRLAARGDIDTAVGQVHTREKEESDTTRHPSYKNQPDPDII